MTEPQQLGFGFDEILREQETAHLPTDMEEAIPYYRTLLEKHNAAMLAGDVEKTMAIRGEARELAIKLNGGTSLGILGGDGAPACVLERETAAPAGTIPLWGQVGDFEIKVGGMPVRIEQDGIFGIGSSHSYWPNFSTHAVDPDKPFLSETGYRSFMGVHAVPIPGMTPDEFARKVIEAHVAHECKGKLRKIERSYVEREMARRAEKATSAQEPEL